MEKQGAVCLCLRKNMKNSNSNFKSSLNLDSSLRFVSYVLWDLGIPTSMSRSFPRKIEQCTVCLICYCRNQAKLLHVWRFFLAMKSCKYINFIRASDTAPVSNHLFVTAVTIKTKMWKWLKGIKTMYTFCFHSSNMFLWFFCFVLCFKQESWQFI